MKALVSRMFVAILFVLIALNGANAQPHDQQTKHSSLENLVTYVYKEYAWTIIFAPPKDSSSVLLLHQERLNKLREFFVDDLALAIFNDTQCVNKTREICLLDFDILFDSQDPDARDLLIRSKAPQIVEVCFSDQTGQKKCVELLGTLGKSGVRIRDIRYDYGRSIRTVLKLK